MLPNQPSLLDTSLDIQASTDSDSGLRVFCDKAKYVCSFKGCNLHFLRQDRLDRHMFSHTNIRTHICPFEECTKRYATHSHMRRHIRKSHVKPQNAIEQLRIPCEHPGCSNSFANRTSMLRHTKTKHLEVKSHKCDQCDEAFARKDQLRRHYTKHTGKMPHPCPHCPAGFMNLKQLRHHVVVHQAARRYDCDKCPEVFDKWSSLVAHRRQSHPIVCQECGREFVKGACFKIHMASHKETEEVFACVVENCPKYYKQRRNLTAHVRRRHTENSGFECDLCGTRLVTKQKLKLHLAWHIRHPERHLVKTMPKVLVRKPRKDKGIPKRSIASLLTNVIEVTNHVEPVPSLDVEMPDAIVSDESKTDESSDVLKSLLNQETKRMLRQWESDKEQEYSSGMEL